MKGCNPLLSEPKSGDSAIYAPENSAISIFHLASDLCFREFRFLFALASRAGVSDLCSAWISFLFPIPHRERGVNDLGSWQSRFFITDPAEDLVFI